MPVPVSVRCSRAERFHWMHYREFVCAVPIRPAWPGRPAGRARPGRASVAPNPKPLFDFAINPITLVNGYFIVCVFFYQLFSFQYNKEENRNYKRYLSSKEANSARSCSGSNPAIHPE